MLMMNSKREDLEGFRLTVKRRKEKNFKGTCPKHLRVKLLLSCPRKTAQRFLKIDLDLKVSRTLRRKQIRTWTLKIMMKRISFSKKKIHRSWRLHWWRNLICKGKYEMNRSSLWTLPIAKESFLLKRRKAKVKNPRGSSECRHWDRRWYWRLYQQGKEEKQRRKERTFSHPILKTNHWNEK